MAQQSGINSEEMDYMYTTDAWVLHKGAADAGPGHLELQSISFPPLEAEEVLVEPLFGSWEGNMSHAVERDPVDICVMRNEPWAVLGNSGVVRVLQAGSDVQDLHPGDCCLFGAAGTSDPYGYMITVHGYDAPGTIGMLAKQTKVDRKNLVLLSTETRFSLAQWAAFSLRYLTAWSNWSTAYGCLRSQLSQEDLPTPHVWGWGGGCTFAELDLAKRAGCDVVMLSGNDQNICMIKAQGITPVDRRSFPDLDFDLARYKTDQEYREAYRSSEQQFLHEVMIRTSGNGVSIFIDYIGSPVARASMRALARQGVLTTAGWKGGLMTSFNRAMECIGRHIYVHTHACRYSEGEPAITYAEHNGWMPPVKAEDIYDFEEIPQLINDYAAGKTGYFPVYRVAN
jgi:NADPH:quinone reductase-like Zn-dependent oxidoreductase